MTIKTLGWEARIGVSEKPTNSRYKSPVVFLYSGGSDGVRINMSPSEARVVARRLKWWADAAEPPVKHKHQKPKAS